MSAIFWDFRNRFILEKINSMAAVQLNELHQIMYKEICNVNQIKNKIAEFPGFEYDAVEQNVNYVQNAVSADGLQHVCEILGIQIDKNALSKIDMAKQIVKYLTINNEVEDSESIHSAKSKSSQRSSLHTEITLRRKIQAIDEENIDIQTKINDEESKIEQIDEEVVTIQKNQDLNSDQIDIQTKKLNNEKRHIERNLNILKAKAQGLESKKETFKTAIEIEKEYSKPEQSVKSAFKSKYVNNWVEQSTKNINLNDVDVSLKNCTSQINQNCVQEDVGLLKDTISQMLARQAVGIKLPDFDGSSPLMWYHFYSQYQLTTQKCKLSPEENMLRLDKCLKGEAREKVDMLLIAASNPDKIINILNRHYGNPEQIFRELIMKAKQIKPVDSLQKFVDYNCVIQNITAAVENTPDVMFIPKLLAIFTDKLPQHLVVQWATNLMLKKN